MSPELIKHKKNIIKALKDGASYKDAAAKAGVHIRTLQRWLEKGKQHSDDPNNEYAIFYIEAEKAMLIAKTVLIQKLMQDPWEVRHERTRPAPDGVGTVKSVKVRRSQSARVIQWIMEKRYPDEYGPQLIEGGKSDDDPPPPPTDAMKQAFPGGINNNDE